MLLEREPRGIRSTREGGHGVEAGEERPLPLSIADASTGMVSFRVRVSEKDVVFVKGLVEASEGLGAVFADAGGDLAITAPQSRAVELADLLADLELDGVVTSPARS
jgi:hypothetical protein